MATFPNPGPIPPKMPLGRGTPFPPAPPAPASWPTGTGPNIVQNFTPPVGGGGALTLQALMDRQKAAALAQQQNMQNPQGTILGGLGQVAGSVFNALNARKAEKEHQLGTEEIVNAISSIDPATGEASPEILAAIGRRDPDLMLQLWQGAMEARRAAASQEQWTPIDTPEGETGQWFQNQAGDTKRVGGRTDPLISMGGDKKWNETGALKFGERVDAYSAEGLDAQRQKLQIGQLRDLMVDMPSGIDAKAADYLQKNWGISVGEGSDKLQAFNAIIDKMVPSQRPAGAGTMSDRDIDLYKGSLPSYLGTDEGNAMVLSTMDAMADYNIALGQIADEVLQIDDAREARKVFNERVKKLPDPLAAWRAMEDQRRQNRPRTPPAADDDGITVGEPVETED